MQLTLLPLIKQDGHGTMTLSRYTEINQKLVQQHKAGCEKLYEKYVRFGNTWHDAQNNLLQAIATAKKVSSPQLL